MPKFYEGNLSAKNLKIAIIISKFNEFITNNLLEVSINTLKRYECEDENIFVYKVPGAMEIPILAKKLALSEQYQAIICLASIIKGETSHFDYLASSSINSILNTSLEVGIPIINGILTTENIEQAIQRIGSKFGNKGRDVSLIAIEMANLYKKITKLNELGFN